MTEFGEALRNDVETAFVRKLASDKKLRRIANRVRDGTYIDASDYSVRVGELMSEAFLENTETLSFMSKEVAEEVIPPVMSIGYENILEAARTVQETMNAADGVGLGVMVADLDTGRINGIVDKVGSYSVFDDARETLKEPLVNFAQAVIDDTIRKNAEVSSKVGLKSYIVRKTEAARTVTREQRVVSKKGKVYRYIRRYNEPCEWCQSLAGRYEYGKEPHDVYRKHSFCRCTVTFERGKKRQDVWSKKEWTADDATAQREIVEKAMPKEPEIPNNDIVEKLGEPAYRVVDKHVQNVDEKSRAVWKKYEDRIKVSETDLRGTAYARAEHIHFNLERDLNPTGTYQKELQVFFHESHHAIDSLAGRDFGGAFHFSSHYKEGIFPNTIVDEVQSLIKERGERIKAMIKAGDAQGLRDMGVISDWNWKYYYNEDVRKVKYSKSMAYASLRNEVRALPDESRCDLSDILEGATNGRISCGFGHGKSYWTQRTHFGVRDGLATEAFAEMSDSTFSNPESLAAIEKYLPKSYGVYREMIEYLAK